ncbi:hypothetical protein RhiirA4_456555 [Rhizophagus irregularis]|uniref:Uncharacterized protein n=1 Tax=Rhizophagus irregularis TaxID=588596 RepID=A0A2I1G7T5_9GLOM|nr:hypothetical protein RhiirA4_456555 [Rhizophagus irregularis]
MPVKNRSIKAFYNHKCMQPNLYHIFWNLEMLTEKLTPEEKMKLTHTERLQMHKLSSDMLERFVIKIEEELANIQEDLSVPAEIIMAPVSEIVQKIEEAKHNLLEIKEWESCMEKEHLKKKERYDFHLLMKVVSKFTADKLNCIPENIKKYKAMDVRQLQFLDSFQHVEIDDGLDPSHYVSASEIFNDSLYKSSGVELKFMTDMDEYLIVENSICRGMTMANHRYAKANNLKCPDYDSSKLTTWILYKDMNALYSDANREYLSSFEARI